MRSTNNITKLPRPRKYLTSPYKYIMYCNIITNIVEKKSLEFKKKKKHDKSYKYIYYIIYDIIYHIIK
jgi:hypothetical protein